MKNFINFLLNYFSLTNKPYKYETFYDWQPFVKPPYNHIETWVLDYAESAFNAGRERNTNNT